MCKSQQAVVHVPELRAHSPSKIELGLGGESLIFTLGDKKLTIDADQAALLEQEGVTTALTVAMWRKAVLETWRDHLRGSGHVQKLR